MASREKILVEMALRNQSYVVPSWTMIKEEIVLPLEDDEERFDSTESDRESIHSFHETSSEQTADDSESEIKPDSSNIILGRDKTTRWKLTPPNTQVRTGRENIVTPPSGVKSIAKNEKTRLACWKLFFSDHIIEHIVKCTNKYLGKMRPNYSRERDCRETDITEMYALLGLLYMAGVKRAQHLNVKELWDTNGSSPECFRATMSRERFLLLLRALRFDDVDTRDERKLQDNLAAIREVFEDFNLRCKNCYQVGEYTTIDEMLEAFRGKCKFRQYISSKPAKYGIKIYALTDARLFYTYNMEIYPGKQPAGTYKYDNSAKSVVMRLAQPILGTGRNITMDNYFVSIPLAMELLKKKTTMVGTIRKNKPEIPPSFLVVKNRERYSSRFAFLEPKGVLVSYNPKSANIRNVLCFSTLHNDNKIDMSTNELAKPEIITFYNLTKSGVDVVDEMKSFYSVSRVSCRWPLTIFFSLLNIGGINSQIIYKLNTGIVEDRRIFLEELALDLMKSHLLIRSQGPSLSVPQRQKMKRIAGVEEVDRANSDETNTAFCSFCPRRKNRKSKKKCNDCNKTVCTEHSVNICLSCAQ